MKKIIYLLVFLPLLTNAQQAYKVYYNVVNETKDWISEPLDVDFTVELRNIDFNYELITNGDEDFSYVLTDTIYSSLNFTKWKAYDWKGDDCDVSIGLDLDKNQYIIIQYTDMGWCLFFNKN